MDEENNTEATEQQVTEPQAAPVEEAPAEKPEAFDKLSNREALAKAIAEKREIRETPAEKSETGTPTQKEVKQAVDADPEPPAEFSAAGKKAWKDKDITGIQKEFRRIHDSRTQEITRAQQAERQAREEHKTYRELAKMAAPYIEARGAEGVPPEKAIMEALSLIGELKKANPQTVKAELKRIGIDLDAATKDSAAVPDDTIKALQEQVNSLVQDKEAQKIERAVQTYSAIYQNLSSLKTRTGEPVFPDLLDNSEAGIQFGRELGSLTQDPKFQQGVLRRFPDADLLVVVREAYKYLGGRVSGEPVTVSPKNKEHIEKARRAAASTPGGVVRRSEASSLIGKLSNRAALQRALEESREH